MNSQKIRLGFLIWDNDHWKKLLVSAHTRCLKKQVDCWPIN